MALAAAAEEEGLVAVRPARASIAGEVDEVALAAAGGVEAVDEVAGAPRSASLRAAAKSKRSPPAPPVRMSAPASAAEDVVAVAADEPVGAAEADEAVVAGVALE